MTWEEDGKRKYLEVTWWAFSEENIKNLYYNPKDDGGTNIHIDWFDKAYHIKPRTVWDSDGKPSVYEARYEICAPGKINKSKYWDYIKRPFMADISDENDVIGWFDFLIGFPLQSVEVGAIAFSNLNASRRQIKWQDIEATHVTDDSPAPPVPDNLFDWKDVNNIVFNYLYIDESRVDSLADEIPGQVIPSSIGFWFRKIITVDDDINKIIPGEFLGLVIRLFPLAIWWEQYSDALLVSGHWADTIYYTTGEIIEKYAPDETCPFTRYVVRWRFSGQGYEFVCFPSGFEEYEIGDIVTIIKDANTNRSTQTWQDDQEFNSEVWRIAPITFYYDKHV